MQLTISIPRFRLVDEPPEKTHYVYVIEFIEGGKTHRVERRYSAFHYLHRQLRKCYRTPPFPPKRVRSFQPKILERRRLSLEHYLQIMVEFAPSRPQILSFLEIQETTHTPGLPLDGFENQLILHRPIFQYDEDPYLFCIDNSSLPDVVARGVQMALYD